MKIGIGVVIVFLVCVIFAPARPALTVVAQAEECRQVGLEPFATGAIQYVPYLDQGGDHFGV